MPLVLFLHCSSRGELDDARRANCALGECCVRIVRRDRCMRRRTTIATADSAESHTDRRSDGTADSRQHSVCGGDDHRTRHSDACSDGPNSRTDKRSASLADGIGGCFGFRGASCRIRFEYSGRHHARANAHESGAKRNFYACDAAALAASRTEHLDHRLRGRRVFGARNTLGAAEFFVHALAEQHRKRRELLRRFIRSDERRAGLATWVRRPGCAVRRFALVHRNRRRDDVRRKPTILVRTLRGEHGRGDTDTGAFGNTGSIVFDFIE